MTRRWAALFLIAVTISGQALACPEPTQGLLFHSCWFAEGAGARLLLLPEDDPDALSGQGFLVTGAYTSRETRKDGRAKPVGLFMRDGEVANRNLGRMDGILVIDPAQPVPRIYHRSRVPVGEGVYNLTMLDQRNEFLIQASARRLSVLQSHLLIVNGRPDVTPRDDAPEHVRRILFTDGAGFGLWQSAGPLTLHEAAETLAARFAPRMALNLDMGSYDLCWRLEDGSRQNCAQLGGVDPGKLSNLLFVGAE